MAQGFANVRRHPAPTREMQARNQPTMRTDAQGQTTFAGGLTTGGQVSDLGGGKFGVSAAPGSVGDTSPNYYDDPTINAMVKLPSLAQASEYMGTKPSFYGVQRPGDYQRVVQRQMANDVSGGKVGQMIENRTDAAKARSGDLSPSAFATARAVGGFEGLPTDFSLTPPKQRRGAFA